MLYSKRINCIRQQMSARRLAWSEVKGLRSHGMVPALTVCQRLNYWVAAIRWISWPSHRPCISALSHSSTVGILNPTLDILLLWPLTTLKSDKTNSKLQDKESSRAVWKSRWPSWAPVPNKPTVSAEVKQHSADHSSPKTASFPLVFLWQYVCNHTAHRQIQSCQVAFPL